MIGLDVDGVIADFMGELLRAIKAQHRIRIKPKDVVYYNLERTFGPDVWRKAAAILCAPGFAGRLAPYPGAQAFVAGLRQIDRVVFVTAPHTDSRTWCYDRLRWLEEHFNATSKDVVFAKDKTAFGGWLLIDDDPQQLRAWIDTGRQAIRIVRPWNKNAVGHEAGTWIRAVKIATELYGNSAKSQSLPLPHLG